MIFFFITYRAAIPWSSNEDFETIRPTSIVEKQKVIKLIKSLTKFGPEGRKKKSFFPRSSRPVLAIWPSCPRIQGKRNSVDPRLREFSNFRPYRTRIKGWKKKYAVPRTQRKQFLSSLKRRTRVRLPWTRIYFPQKNKKCNTGSDASSYSKGGKEDHRTWWKSGKIIWWKQSSPVGTTATLKEGITRPNLDPRIPNMDDWSPRDIRSVTNTEPCSTGNCMKTSNKKPRKEHNKYQLTGRQWFRIQQSIFVTSYYCECQTTDKFIPISSSQCDKRRIL